MRSFLLALIVAAVVIVAGGPAFAGAPGKGTRGTTKGTTPTPVTPPAPTTPAPKATPATPAAPAATPTTAAPAATPTPTAAPTPIAPADPAPAVDPADPPTSSASAGADSDSPVHSETTDYNVFTIAADKTEKKIGSMSVKVTTANSVMFIDEVLRLPVKDKEVELTTQIVYRGLDKPVPQRAKVVTKLGDFKLMEGTVTFTPKDGGLVAREDVTGYADKEGRPFPKPLTTTKDVPVPAGQFLAFAPTLYLAPRLLPRPGTINKVVYVRLPKDYVYPIFSEYLGNCTLVRGESSDDGRAEFTVKELFPGGNAQVRFSTICDSDGKVLEVHVPSGTSNLVYRPVPPEPPLKAPTPTKSGGK